MTNKKVARLVEILGISAEKIWSMFDRPAKPLVPVTSDHEEAGEILDKTIPGTKKCDAAAQQYENLLKKERPELF